MRQTGISYFFLYSYHHTNNIVLIKLLFLWVISAVKPARRVMNGWYEDVRLSIYTYGWLNNGIPQRKIWFYLLYKRNIINLGEWAQNNNIISVIATFNLNSWEHDAFIKFSWKHMRTVNEIFYCIKKDIKIYSIGFSKSDTHISIFIFSIKLQRHTLKEFLKQVMIRS